MKDALEAWAGKTQLKFELHDAFSRDSAELGAVSVGISLETTGFDYTSGVGTNIYRIKNNKEHNMAFGSPIFAKVMSQSLLSTESARACQAAILC